MIPVFVSQFTAAYYVLVLQLHYKYGKYCFVMNAALVRIRLAL